MSTGIENSRNAQDSADYKDQLLRKNHALASALTKAAEELKNLKTQMTYLGEPPTSFATFIKVDSYSPAHDGARLASAQVFHNGRRIIVAVSPTVAVSRLVPGEQVLLNENLVLASSRADLGIGPLRVVDEVLDSQRLLVSDTAGATTVVRRSSELADKTIDHGDRVRLDPSATFAMERLDDADADDMLLEEVPDVRFEDIGGLNDQIQAVRDAVELPYRHRELFEQFHLTAPKGVLLYGPPGNGKTLIAKAVARELIESAKPAEGVFLSVKGPEILNKYVGESERLIRSIFKRARAKATEGVPVIVFIDEMDSLLRVRGTGISSDVENTIVPQFLAELDGIVALANVIVIGASNRVDMIDPAVLRPGRLDVKVRIPRPTRTQAAAVLTRYLDDSLPTASPAQKLIDAGLDAIYQHTSETLVCELQAGEGAWHPVYFDDLISAASLKNIVDRAKTRAIKAAIAAPSTVSGITQADMIAAVTMEYDDTVGSIAGLSAQQWSSVQGLEFGRILAVRHAPTHSGDEVLS